MAKTGATDCSSDSVDLVTSPSLSSVNNSPLQSQSASNVLNSESIEVLGAVADPRSDNSSFLVVASTASSTPASEFSDNGEQIVEITAGEDGILVEKQKDVAIVQNDDEDDDYEEEEEEENTMSESLAVTVMEPKLSTEKDIVTIPPSARQNLHLPLTATTTPNSPNLLTQSSSEMDGSSSSDQTLMNQQIMTEQPSHTLIESSSQSKSNTVLSLENYELQTEFSDSTHSFEEVPRNIAGEEHHHPTTTTSSGDEMETTTSSDIEIISNPNGCDSSTHSRLSPHKDGGGITASGGILRGHRGHSR